MRPRLRKSGTRTPVQFNVGLGLTEGAESEDAPAKAQLEHPEPAGTRRNDNAAPDKVQVTMPPAPQSAHQPEVEPDRPPRCDRRRWLSGCQPVTAGADQEPEPGRVGLGADV